MHFWGLYKNSAAIRDPKKNLKYDAVFAVLLLLTCLKPQIKLVVSGFAAAAAPAGCCCWYKVGAVVVVFILY